MKLHNPALGAAFLLTGTLPWFTLGPTSTLGVMGWSAGLLAVLAIASGVLSACLASLADQGFRPSTGSAGPRLGAFAASLVALGFSVAWLATAGNTQTNLGAETVLLHFGPGGATAVVLSLITIAVTGHALANTQEPLPRALLDVTTAITNKINQSTRTSNQTRSNQRAQAPRMGSQNRKEGSPMGTARPRPPADVHMPSAGSLQSSGTSPKRTQDSGSNGVRPQDTNTEPDHSGPTS